MRGSINIKKERGVINIKAGGSKEAVFDKGSADMNFKKQIATPSMGQFPKYIVKEYFYQDPSDWKRHIRAPASNWFTHDAVNKDIDVALCNDYEFPIQNRYSKSHMGMDDSDNFKFEQEYQGTNGGSTPVMMGEFRLLDYEETNIKNSVVVRMLGSQNYYVAQIYDSEGGWHIDGGQVRSITPGTKYKYKCKYDKVSRKLTVERWEGTVYKDKSEIVLPSDKHFYVDDFGIGNHDGPGGSQSTGNYDSAILMIPGSQSISKNMIAVKRSIGIITGG